jgi:hypothetical protein
MSVFREGMPGVLPGRGEAVVNERAERRLIYPAGSLGCPQPDAWLAAPLASVIGGSRGDHFLFCVYRRNRSKTLSFGTNLS